MRATEDDATRDVLPPTMLGYAPRRARQPLRFGGPLAYLALTGAVVALVPVLMVLTNGLGSGGLRTRGLMTLLLLLAIPIALGVASLFDRSALPSDRRSARHAIWLGGAEIILMIAAAVVVANRPNAV